MVTKPRDKITVAFKASPSTIHPKTTLNTGDKKLKDAIDGNSFGVLLSYNAINTKNTTFNKLYNYPERGFSFLYQNFNSDVLGEVFGGYRHYNYNLKFDHQPNP